MLELSIYAGGVTPTVAWERWREAGIGRVELDSNVPSDQVAHVRDAQLRITLRQPAFRTRSGKAVLNALGHPDPEWCYPPTDPIVPASHEPNDRILLYALRFGATLEHARGERWGEATVSELDAWAASVDLSDQSRAEIAEAGGDPDRVRESLRAYLRGRIDGSVPAALSVCDATLRLLLRADCNAVLAARRSAISRVGAELATRLRLQGVAVDVELDGPPAERDHHLASVIGFADQVRIRLEGSLREIRRDAETLIASAGEQATCSISVPSAELPDAERLSDALDLLEGIGFEQVTLTTNAAWLAVGIETVNRAAHRLHGRSSSRHGEPARRRELSAG